ncbi:hypothetical protein A4V12_18345 [Streptomyces noursei]|nr:hypothetical protein A4V12_18345 [Streptomyces noursei]
MAGPVTRLMETAGDRGRRRRREPVTTERQLRIIAAEELQGTGCKDRGRRAQDLLVEFTDIDCIECDL